MYKYWWPFNIRSCSRQSPEAYKGLRPNVKNKKLQKSRSSPAPPSLSLRGGKKKNKEQNDKLSRVYLREARGEKKEKTPYEYTMRSWRQSLLIRCMLVLQRHGVLNISGGCSGGGTRRCCYVLVRDVRIVRVVCWFAGDSNPALQVKIKSFFF